MISSAPSRPSSGVGTLMWAMPARFIAVSPHASLSPLVC
jgi:hypothetical protein